MPDDLYVGQPLFDDMGLEPQLVRPTPISPAAERSEFVEAALVALLKLATHRSQVTADDLYAVMPSAPTHHNEMGGVWRQAVARGWLEDSGQTVRSKRPEAHGRRVPIYRSLVQQ